MKSFYRCLFSACVLSVLFGLSGGLQSVVAQEDGVSIRELQKAQSSAEEPLMASEPSVNLGDPQTLSLRERALRIRVLTKMRMLQVRLRLAGERDKAREVQELSRAVARGDADLGSVIDYLEQLIQWIIDNPDELIRLIETIMDIVDTVIDLFTETQAVSANYSQTPYPSPSYVGCLGSFSTCA